MANVATMMILLAGLGMILIGFWRKSVLKMGMGSCFIGSAIFGYMARSNEIYSWLQIMFSCAIIVLALIEIIKALQKIKSA